MLSNQWLQNKSFIQWRLFPSEEDNLYWKKFIQDNPHFQNEIEEAIRILKSIKLNTQKLSSRRETGNICINTKKYRKERQTTSLPDISDRIGSCLYRPISGFTTTTIYWQKQDFTQKHACCCRYNLCQSKRYTISTGQ